MGRHTLYGCYDRLAPHRHPQWPTRHHAPGCPSTAPAPEPHGPRFRIAGRDCPQRLAVRGGSGHDRLHHLFAGERAAHRRFCHDPPGSAGREAIPMIAQVVLSLLLGIVLLYAWAQYRRSPIVTILSCGVSLIGFYFVWLPSHATRVAEFVGIGRGADLILYVWACISLVVLLNLHLKLRTQHELLTQLARSIALANATLPEDARPTDASRMSSLTEGQMSQPRYRRADAPTPGQTADQSA